MKAPDYAYAASEINADFVEVRARAASANHRLAESLFRFGVQVRRHIDQYPALFADRSDEEGKRRHRRALDACCRLAREFEWLAFQAFANKHFTPVNREQLEAVVQDLRERVAAAHLADAVGAPAA